MVKYERLFAEAMAFVAHVIICHNVSVFKSVTHLTLSLTEIINNTLSYKVFHMLSHRLVI